MRIPQKTVVFGLVLALFLTGAPGVHAYVLQGAHVIELMVDQNKPIDRLGISQSLTLHDAKMPEHTVVLNETLKYQLPGLFRSDITKDQETRRIYMFVRGTSLTVIQGSVIPDAETAFDAYKDVFLYPSRPDLVRFLSRRGVDVAVSTLGRLDDKIAFVIGANYPDESVPQLWVDKETFLPLRYLVRFEKSAGIKELLDIRFTDWEKAGEIYWYPRRISFSQDGLLVREIQVTGIDINPQFNLDTFDMSALKQAFPLKTTQDIQTSEPGDNMDEVDETIRDFQKMFND